MITNLMLSFLICIVIVILTYIIINYAILLEKLYIKTQYKTEEVPKLNYMELNFQEGLTNREYNALSSSIKEIETVDPSAVFLTSDDLSMYDKMKGNVYYNSPIKFLNSYDNKNIVNYIDALVKINNTTDKNFNELSVSSKKDGIVYSNYSSFVNMKQYLKKNKPLADMTESQKLLEQQKTDERIKGTILNENLDIVISTKLFDMIALLYDDYTKYITDIRGNVDTIKKDNKEKAYNIIEYMNGLASPLTTNIDKSISALNKGISDLNSLNLTKILNEKSLNSISTNFTHDVNNNINNLNKYVSTYTEIKNNKITKHSQLKKK